MEVDSLSKINSSNFVAFYANQCQRNSNAFETRSSNCLDSNLFLLLFQWIFPLAFAVEILWGTGQTFPAKPVHRQIIRTEKLKWLNFRFFSIFYSEIPIGNSNKSIKLKISFVNPLVFVRFWTMGLGAIWSCYTALEIEKMFFENSRDFCLYSR